MIRQLTDQFKNTPNTGATKLLIFLQSTNCPHQGKRVNNPLRLHSG